MFSKKISPLKNTLLFRLTVLYAGIFSLSALLIFVFCYFKIHTVTMHDLDEELLDAISRYAATLSREDVVRLQSELTRDIARELRKICPPPSP